MISLTDTIQSIAQAIDTFAKREVVASAWRTSEWDQAPAEIVNRSFLSAGVEAGRFLSQAQSGISRALDLSRDEYGRLQNREGFIADMRQVALQLGLGSPDQPANLKNLAGATRLGLIYDMNVDSARGRARRASGLSEGALFASHAQELVRGRMPKFKARDWRARWLEAGGQLFGARGVALKTDPIARMVALKTDPVWTKISRFGVPWPPFDFGSGMVLRNVLRADAIALGLIAEDEILEADPDPNFNAGLSATMKGVSQDVVTGLKRLFGDKLNIQGDTVSWANA